MRAQDVKASLSRGCYYAALRAKDVKMRLQDRDAKASWRSGFRHSGRTAVPDESRWASLRYDVRKKAPGGSRCWSSSRTSANCCRWGGSRTNCCYWAANTTNYRRKGGSTTNVNCCRRMKSEKNRKVVSKMSVTLRKMMSVSLNDGRLRKNGC